MDANESIKDLIGKEIINIPTAANYVDEEADFKAFMNGFVLSQMLQTPEKKMNFLGIIYSEFDKMVQICNKKFNLKDNNQVYFVYKGGNLLRLHYNKYIANLQTSGIDVKLFDHPNISGSFGKSDDDFTIMINPKLDKFEQIHDYVTLKSFECLKVLRNKFVGEIGGHFSYFDETKEKKQDTLTEYLLAAKARDQFKCLNAGKYEGYEIVGMQLGDVCISLDKTRFNPETDKDKHKGLITGEPQSANRGDMIITNYKKINGISHYFPHQNFVYSPINNEPNIIYNSSNSTIKIDKNGALSSFVLNRSKINSVLYLINRESKISVYAPGELIDVTIANQDDNGLNHIYEKNTRYSIEEYKFNNGFTFWGYTLDYLIYDLEKMLFGDTNAKPWKDIKFSKRIVRLITLYFMKYSVGNMNTLELGISKVHLLIEVLLETMSDINANLGNPNVIPKKLSKLFEIKPSKITPFEKIADVLITSVSHMILSTITFEKETFQATVDENDIMYKFLVDIESIMSHMKILCQIIDTKYIRPYDMNIKHEHLGGYSRATTNYKNKYLKYKQKYMSLKQ